MSVLNVPSVSYAQQAANQIKQIARQQFNQLGQTGKQGWDLIWKNRLATPQEVLAELGTDATAIFALANLNIDTVITAAVIGGVTAPNIPGIPSGYTVVPNQDGSVTATKA